MNCIVIFRNNINLKLSRAPKARTFTAMRDYELDLSSQDIDWITELGHRVIKVGDAPAPTTEADAPPHDLDVAPEELPEVELTPDLELRINAALLSTYQERRELVADLGATAALRDRKDETLIAYLEDLVDGQ